MKNCVESDLNCDDVLERQLQPRQNYILVRTVTAAGTAVKVGVVEVEHEPNISVQIPIQTPYGL